MSTDVTGRLRQLVAERAYHVCEYCLVHEDDTFWGFEADHIISRKHGGATTSENLAWACACCNSAKGSDIATLIGNPPRLSALFHPRQHRWAECFQLAGITLEPLNDPGAATQKLLQLNHDSRVEERRLLAQAGRYPTVEALARMKE
jgi:hypothetical protein